MIEIVVLYCQNCKESLISNVESLQDCSLKVFSYLFFCNFCEFFPHNSSILFTCLYVCICLPGWFGALIQRRIVQVQMGISPFLGGLNPCQNVGLNIEIGSSRRGRERERGVSLYLSLFLCLSISLHFLPFPLNLSATPNTTNKIFACYFFASKPSNCIIKGRKSYK